jgi:hypothetical protein
MLEPCDGKLSRTVLRGEGSRKAPDLPGCAKRSLALLIGCPVSVPGQEVPIGQSLTSSPYRVLRGLRSRSIDRRTKIVKRTQGTL